MKVLVFRHAPLEDVGYIGRALARHGFGCDFPDLYANPEGIASMESFSGLILMGGSMSVNDDLPWIPREIACIRQALDRGLPVLGICLGSQLIAKALGSRVYPNSVKEIGFAPVCFTESAASDRLFTGFTGPETVLHWHGETFDLPLGAEHLAWSDNCRNQAYRAGANVYGLQFHLEVTPEMLGNWVRENAACGGLHEVQTPIDPHAHAGRLREIATTVFDRWCSLLL